MIKFFLTYYIIFTVRFAAIAGVYFLIFYVIQPVKYKNLKIQNKFPASAEYYHEIIHSLLSCFFFSLYIVILSHTPVRRYTRIYDQISQMGWLYFVVSIFLCVVIHDTYFYWTHRLMHHRLLFRAFHLVHHKSTNPSPWAAFSFHPLEAMVEGGVIPLIAFLIPIHGKAFLIFFAVSTVINVYAHLGYEIYPAWLVKSRIGNWLNTSVAHNMHHKYFNGNYCFYFRFWDIIAGTVHSGYDDHLDSIIKNEVNNKDIKTSVYGTD